MRNVALIGACGSVASWIVFRAAGIEVGAGPFLVYCIVVFATGFAIDFVERRTLDARIESAVVAAGTTLIVRAAVETAALEAEGGVYVVLFATAFVTHLVWLRRRRRRARAPQTGGPETECGAHSGRKARSDPMTSGSCDLGPVIRISRHGDAASMSNAPPRRRAPEDLIVMTEHGCIFPGDCADDDAPSGRIAAAGHIACALHDALSRATAGAAPGPGSPFNPAVLAGRSADEALDALVEAVGPPSGGPDAEASRRAVRDAVSELLERFPDADLMALSEEQRLFVVECYACNELRA